MPDNAVYYHLAYAIATGIYAGYAWLIMVRRRRLRHRAVRDLGT